MTTRRSETAKERAARNAREDREKLFRFFSTILGPFGVGDPDFLAEDPRVQEAFASAGEDIQGFFRDYLAHLRSQTPAGREKTLAEARKRRRQETIAAQEQAAREQEAEFGASQTIREETERTAQRAAAEREVIQQGDIEAAQVFGPQPPLTPEEEQASQAREEQDAAGGFEFFASNFQFAMEELTPALSALLIRERRNLPPGMSEWLSTQTGQEEILSEYLNSGTTESFSAWLGRHSASGGLGGQFKEFVETGGGDELIRALNSGTLTDDQQRLAAAVFENRFGDLVAGSLGELSPEVAQWLQSGEGLSSVVGNYLRTMQRLGNLGQDLNQVSPARFIEQMQAENLDALWADAHPDQAIGRMVLNFTSGLPRELQDELFNELTAQLQQDFADQKLQVGGTTSLSSYMQGGQRLQQFNPLIETRIHQRRARTGAGALLSPEFFGQTTQELFTQASENLRVDLGREPTFEETAAEAQAIQQKQMQAAQEEATAAFAPGTAIFEAGRAQLAQELGVDAGQVSDREVALRAHRLNPNFQLFAPGMFSFGGSPFNQLGEAQQHTARQIGQSATRRQTFGQPIQIPRR